MGRYFLRLGATGFGGPVVLVEAMHRDLVIARGWVSEDEYREGMALAQLSPGPLAAQLCFYLGFLRGGVTGAALSGVAFVLPSFVMVVGLGWAYTRFGGLPWMQAVFYGVGAAVIGLIAKSAARLAGKTLGSDSLLWAICLLLASVTAITARENLWLILLAGLLVGIVRAPPEWLRRTGTAREAGSLVLLLKLLGFFTYAGSFVFGSGLAIVPFLHGGLVVERHWLSERQFIDAVAVALITPGPVVITTGFIGYLIAGLPGACVAAAATFMPCFLLTVLPAPYFHRYGRLTRLKLIVQGITAAATGTIVGAVFVLGRQSLVDRFTIGVALAALALTWIRWKVPEPLLILAAAAAGLLVRGWS
jgi:chromate transporter